ncbi:MAG: hypothetical protein AAB564_02820 [Patescibacteria group bacterium]
MFVITAICGAKFKKARRYSQASHTKYRPVPGIKLLPEYSPNSLPSRLPTITSGFLPALIRIRAIIAVVVVFPWVPATAIVRLPAETAPKTCG